MNIKTITSVGVMALTLAACDSGDLNLSPTNTVTDSNNTTVDSGGSGGGGATTTNPCASFIEGGQSFQGVFEGGNCTYDSTFVSENNPLSVDVTFEALDNGGLHIFNDSLFVGEDVNANAAAQDVRIPQDGEGPTLTIGAGSLMAFFNSNDYVRIGRGSRIIADGTRAAPIIFSAVTDLRDGQATEADRGLWGGVQLNGNGLTNKCTDADRQPSGNNPHNCHVAAEGFPSSYGGTNNAENSGVLRYVQIRHAGFQVVDGDELNGLTLNGIGSGTTIEFVQTYTTLDDGFEMFGGAVDLNNIVALNVGDDSIDYSEGWVGDIQFALAIHTSGSNRCIEADNTGSSRDDDIAPFTKGRISNMTCITSNVDSDQGSAPSSKGDSEGPIYREGAYFELYNSIITSNDTGMASNECFEIDSEVSVAGINQGFSAASGNVIACTEALKIAGDAGLDLSSWWTAGGNVAIDSESALPATLIEGLSPSNPKVYVTAANLTDANGAAINVGVFDVTQLQDDFAAGAQPQVGSAGSSSFFKSVDFLGAVSADDDWVSGWTHEL
ncbi:MAG: hypothetical protein WDZ52_08545 [Pseudohongiellaceae bacterium]